MNALRNDMTADVFARCEKGVGRVIVSFLSAGLLDGFVWNLRQVVVKFTGVQADDPCRINRDIRR